MAFAQRNGVRIHYETLGSSDKPALVLSHSLGASLAMWQPQLNALSQHFQIVLYDMRGHGQSSIPAEPFDIAALGGDVLHLLDDLGIAQACFCGLSMGGVIGQWLGIHAPDRLYKLVLSSTAAKIGTSDGWNTRIAGVLSEGIGPIVAGTMERWFTAPFRAAHAEIVEAIASTLRATDPHGYAACCAAIRDADFRESVSAIRLPVLILSGTHDPATTTADGRFLADKIAASQYIELLAAHISNIEAADAFTAAVLDFLR
ncbi:MAG TPA: 3-oxoadipate enol-lactonase [Acidobacteriaceae bacterium]|jgi:3-oxoadipate enol-lactonase/4-carboxymuconolactone decarboxylase|nr:3-oxoadipate enol-lactonase [Acidobacteriaceae bacterium]